jgi:hypothetical protein
MLWGRPDDTLSILSVTARSSYCQRSGKRRTLLIDTIQGEAS